MTDASNSNLLPKKAAELVDKALVEIRAGRIQACNAKEPGFRVAEYLLEEAKEYVNAAFDLLDAGQAGASLTVSRWVLEAALNLLWATSDDAQIRDRLKSLLAEAIRQDAIRSESLAELYPQQADALRKRALAAREQVKKMMGQQGKTLRPLAERIASMRDKLKARGAPSPYALFRICCAAAHPALDISRRLHAGPGGATVTHKPPDRTFDARFIAAASTLWLVAGAYCLTSLGNKEDLVSCWTNKMLPLI